MAVTFYELLWAAHCLTIIGTLSRQSLGTLGTLDTLGTLGTLSGLTVPMPTYQRQASGGCFYSPSLLLFMIFVHE